MGLEVRLGEVGPIPLEPKGLVPCVMALAPLAACVRWYGPLVPSVRGLAPSLEGIFTWPKEVGLLTPVPRGGCP